MKTDELINMLANHAPPVDRQIVTRRFGTALVIGLALALLVLLTVFGIRPDIGQVAATPLFWAKLALPASLLAGALHLGDDLAG